MSLCQAKTETAPWEDLKCELNKEWGKKTWESFFSYVIFPPADGVQAQCQGSSEVPYHQHPQESQLSASASIFQVCTAAQQLAQDTTMHVLQP